MKIVVNKCFGGFGLSEEAENLYAKYSGFKLFRYVQVEGNRYKKVKEYNNMWLIVTLTEDQGEEFIYNSSKEQGWWHSNDIERNDPILVQVVEELKDKASDRYSHLKVVEIPNDIVWEIVGHDGMENIHEVHRSWG